MTIKVKATITGVEERVGEYTQKPYDLVEYTLKVCVGISRDERAKWKRDQLTEAVGVDSGTPLTELIGKDVVLELTNETYNKHIYVRARNVLPLSALNEEES